MADRNNTSWVTYDDREILIKDLTVRHLVNILNWIEEANSDPAIKAYPEEIYQLMLAEARLRIMTGWAANTGIPRLRAYGVWEVTNLTAEEKMVEDYLTAQHREKMTEVAMQKKLNRTLRINNLLHQKSAEKDRLLENFNL